MTRINPPGGSGSEPRASNPAGPVLRKPLAVILLSRTSLNVAARMAYPFLPIFSRGLGLPLAAITTMVTARSALGLISPVFGSIADRYGRREIMIAGLALLGMGGALCFGVPGRAPSLGSPTSQPIAWLVALFFAGFLLMGLGKILYDPSMQAYLSDRVRYAQRGRVLGVTELAWAGANLVGLPVAGLLIERYGWRAPFGALALLGAGSALLTWRVLSPDRPARRPGIRTAPSPIVDEAAASGLLARAPLAAMAMGFLLAAANENLFIVYGAWMEQSFGLRAAGLGFVAAVFGVAELLGEALSTGIVDRVGKRRSVVIGALLAAAGYALLPRLGSQLAWAVIGLFYLLLWFEFTFVASLPLVSELLPQARGTMMSVNVAALSAGRMIAAPVGVLIWQSAGFGANGLVSALMNLVAAGLLVWGVRGEGGLPQRATVWQPDLPEQ